MLLRLKDYLSLANAASGFTAVVVAKEFGLLPAIFLVFLAALFDFVDGKVARSRKEHNEFGLHLDSAADAVSFCAAPALIIAQALPSPVVMIGALFYLMAGLIRLARHNIQEEKTHYAGLPSPIAALFVMAFAVPFSSFSEILPAAFLFVLGALMLSQIKLKKL